MFAFHTGGANVLFVDVSVRLLTTATTAGTLIRLVNAAGGDATPE